MVIAGPTTFAALLNSLQMGFRTLAIQQKSSEVWKVLGGVKAQFEKYSTAMSKVKMKLEQASQAVDDVDRRTRVLNQSLRKVETSSGSEGENGGDLLDLAIAAESEDVLVPGNPL